MTLHFFKAMGGRTFASAAALVAGVCSLKLYSHYLGPQIYGGIVVALQFMDYLRFLDGGFRTVANQKILASSDEEERQELVAFCQVLYSIVGILLISLGILGMAVYSVTAPATASQQGPSFFLALGLTGSLSIIGGLQLGLLIGLGAQAAFFVLLGIKSFVTLAALWLAFISGFGVWAFPLSSFAGVLGTYPLGIYLLRRLHPQFRIFSLDLNATFGKHFHNLKRDALACFRSQIATIILFTADIIFVGYLAGPVTVAAYGVLARVFKIMRAFVEASGEALWPLVAKHGQIAKEFSQILMRMNAWLYGSITGVSIIALPPFLDWFMGEEWVASHLVIVLVAARFMITGIASVFTYLLYGLGEFKLITRHLERELGAAVVLSLPLGWFWGAEGVSGGFLASTAFGTLFPLIGAYAHHAGYDLGRLLLTVWWRMGVAASVSAAITSLLLPGISGPLVIVVAGVGGASGLLVGLGISFFRFYRNLSWESFMDSLYYSLKRM